MLVFPSEEWCRALIAAIHAEPESLKAGKGFAGDVVCVVEAEPPALEEPFAIWARAAEGKVEEFRTLEDLDEVDEIEPKYVVRAKYATWKRIIRGELDPLEAVLRQQIELTGDMQPIIERSQFKNLVWRVLGKVPTRFP